MTNKKWVMMGMLASALAFGLVLAGCDDGNNGNGGEGGGGNGNGNGNGNTSTNPDTGKDGTPGKVAELPQGKTDTNGLLTIRSNANYEVLLFTSSVKAENYIGKIDNLDSVKVKLPDEKFYTIVAVARDAWERKGDQAAQFSSLTYYSNTQAYSITVNPSNISGGGTWLIYNNTNYWIAFKKSDLSENFAVVAPNATRVAVPVALDTSYDYVPYYYKELKYNNKIVALIEGSVPGGENIVYIRSDNNALSFITEIGGTATGAIKPPNDAMKPAILVKNSTSNVSVRVYSGQNNQLSNGASGTDFVLASGDEQMFTSGFGTNPNTSEINFLLPGSGGRVTVSENKSMANGKVYYIVLSGSTGSYTITVTEQDASEYFN